MAYKVLRHCFFALMVQWQTDNGLGGRHEDMKDLRCMSFTSKGTSEIIVAGLQDKMFVIDLTKGEVMKQVSHLHRDKAEITNLSRFQRSINIQ